MGAGGRAREDEAEDEVDLRLKGLIGVLSWEAGIGTGSEGWWEIDRRLSAFVRSWELSEEGTVGSPAPSDLASGFPSPSLFIVVSVLYS